MYVFINLLKKSGGIIFFFIKHKSFFSQIIKSNFEIIEVLLEFQFLVKYDSKIFVLVDKWDFV